MPSLTFDKLIKDTSTGIFIDTTDKYVNRVSDIGTDSIVGGYYQFYKNGHLKSYDFTVQRTIDPSVSFIRKYRDSIISISSYGEAYDSLGRLDSVYRIPLVYKLIRNRENTTDFVFYFFSMDKEYKNVIAKTSNNLSFALTLKQSRRYTNMYYDEIKVVTKGLSKISVIVNCTYLNKCSGKTLIFNDTSSFDKTRGIVVDNGR